ncbi:TetR/AcrR family transcriptional regulator [Nocardioides cheoyonin]|uniref:TetR/AcrR family transcriptional regulator n=1 Tax=Nocardioides cheoyonin TaxID=3156615 RepID=UPI0032B3BE21
MTTERSTESLRDLARHAVRDEVLRHAWVLFASQGFDATTIDQVAEAAGMSRRTFFRYFSGKDELIIEKLVEAGELVAAALAERPADESPWAALRAAFGVVVRSAETHAEQARTLRILLRDEPGVRGSLEEWRRRWTELLAPIVAARLAPAGRRAKRPDVRADVRAEALAGSALACLDAAQTVWADHPRSSLSALLDEAMGAILPLDR